ncbi:tetratricopeptide repeat protein [Arenicella xantha]|uniref:Tfp pilus assembly protein PilF n=1 Tax=Arenicella xantha TaxID=644221 RepID=A0A395JNR8_9GAMM|nr:tetratricopeptide repeat protein [Arenicella xantha]RBP53294.1 Tfp pilus assembly protein PilF [Arenicella xantha]
MQDLLKSAYQDLQNQQPQQAISKLQSIAAQVPNNADVAHLLALSYKALGDKARAKQHFKQSLELNEHQPEVLNNLANLLKSEESYSDAEAHYRRAVELNPKYLQAWRNLGICLQAQSHYEAALESYQRALDLAPNDSSALIGLADAQRLIGDLEKAESLYVSVLAIDPQKVNGWHNLGLVFHLQGKLTKALECYHKAFELAGPRPEVSQSLALCLHEAGKTQQSIQIFERALQQNPDHIELHERFNAMLWESEFASEFGESYRSALSQLSGNLSLIESYASLLFRAGHVTQAKQVLERYASGALDNHNLLALQGTIAAEMGDLSTAYHMMTRSLEIQYAKDVAQQLIKIDILLSRYAQAQDLLNQAFIEAPNCQLNWALQSLIWRLSGDKRYHWLMQYEKFVQVYKIAVPAGYDNLAAFLTDVENALIPMHRTEREPLLQTLRNGTQTASRLLHSPHPAIKALKECLQKIVRDYISGLPDDLNHPFLSRKREQFDFSGSWSVKLRANGFHVNHVHPEGWISSSCYITIPRGMHESSSIDIDPETESVDVAADNQGCIKFGESPLQLGDRDVIEMCVRPKPGMVVLFPSYCWHGTFPFSGTDSDYRMTAPFDILPVG